MLNPPLIAQRLRAWGPKGANRQYIAKLTVEGADEIERLERELRAARAALVMIRGVVAGVLEDEQMKGGEFA